MPYIAREPQYRPYWCHNCEGWFIVTEPASWFAVPRLKPGECSHAGESRLVPSNRQAPADVLEVVVERIAQLASLCKVGRPTAATSALLTEALAELIAAVRADEQASGIGAS